MSKSMSRRANVTSCRNIRSMLSPVEAIHEYYRIFSTLDIDAIVRCYCEASMTLTPNAALSAPNRTALADSLAPLITSLKNRGYGRSEFVQPDTTMLSETSALIRGTAVRYTAAGSELEQIPLSYLMHLGDDGWKIAVLVI